VSAIFFDGNGVCNYCHQVERLKEEYGTGTDQGDRRFKEIIADAKKTGRGKQYDCIVGVSGGTDSSYMVYMLRERGLRPLAVHYDNTWNTSVSTLNIYRVLKHFDVDLFTHVVSNTEADDIFRAFFLAGVPEIDASTDLGYAWVLRQAAHRYNIKYIFEGHSFVEEGITPLANNYCDGRYIMDIHERYGSETLNTYPLMTLGRFLRSSVLSGVRFVRPFWYVRYSKDEARRFLEDECGWQYYGGHHLENRMAAFAHTVYLPRKFSTDLRNNTLAAQVRNGRLDRDSAIGEYLMNVVVDPDLIDYFKRRLGFTDIEYEQIMEQPPRSWTEFRTYKRQFELLAPLFFVLAKTNRVPMSFYIKYCKQQQEIR